MANSITPTLALDTTAATTHDPICIEGFRRGHVYSGAFGGTAHDVIGSCTAVQFWTASTRGGNYELAHTSANAAITVTLTDERHFEIPSTVFGANYMKMVAVGASWTAHCSFSEI